MDFLFQIVIVDHKCCASDGLFRVLFVCIILAPCRSEHDKTTCRPPSPRVMATGWDQSPRRVEIITPRHSFVAPRDEPLCALMNWKDTVYLCDACLSVFAESADLEAHSHQCPYQFYIPGSEVYRDASRSFSIFEIDGRAPQGMFYARRLAFVARLFLADKVTLDDVHYFCFYPLYELDDFGYHFTGYFSKELKNSSSCMNTLSCVVLLPPYRKKGYGALLGSFSYELARWDNTTGTPERPLSADGKTLFRKIWKEEVLQAVLELERNRIPVTLNSICQTSGLIVEDALVALHDLNCLFIVGKQVPFFVLSGERVSSRKRRRIEGDKVLYLPSL